MLNVNQVILISGFIALVLAVASTKMLRGIRNNNPGNIKRTGIKWNGMTSSQPDPVFVSFVTAKMGIRAMAIILHGYKTRYGLHTVRGIINRYSPSSENNTTAYINDVSKRLGVSPDSPINVDTRMTEIINAIISHEQGVNTYAQSTINSGILLSGVA